MKEIAMQMQHQLLPKTTHDEYGLQSFVVSMRKYGTSVLAPGNRVAYENQVEPKILSNMGRKPLDRHEVRKGMLQNQFHRYWSSLMRTTQEMIWDSPGDSALRQIENLNNRALLKKSAIGKLKLDSSVKIPRYLSGIDIHCMPGNYHQEVTNHQDIYAAALYDRGVYIYLMGSMGPLNDALGTMMVKHVERRWPKFSPKRILDIGCGIGAGTLPFVDAFPKADVYGIDVAAPMLVYAHARSEYLKKKVYFSQQNGEKTVFPDNYFDLVMTHIVLHETSHKALLNILKECHRLLKPGGITLHCETPMYDDRLSPFEQYETDWDTYFNNEPFVGPMHSLDANKLMLKAGFKFEELVNTDLQLKMSKPQKNGEFGERLGGYLSILGAQLTPH